MRKYLIAISLMLTLSVAVAPAANAVTLVGSVYPSDISATVTASFASSVLTITVTNTSTADAAALTSLGFHVPDDWTLAFTGAYHHHPDDSEFVWEQNENHTYRWGFGSISGMDLSGRSATQPYHGYVNAGLFTKPDVGFLGGWTNLGIPVGADNTAIFTFKLESGTYTGIDTFIARFQGVDIGSLTGASDLATPTPVPGALWLFGSGLIGLVGLRRFRG